MNLPDSFTKVLEKYGIDKKQIVFAVMADLDQEFRFADTIVALTDKKLIIARYPYVEKREFRLGGYESWIVHESTLALPAVLFYDLEEVEELTVLRQVSTGVFMGKIKGVEQYLCQFSNTKMESFMKMGRLLHKMKEKEEILEEDLDVKKGEVVTIIGTSGSGKSTLLRCCNLLEYPDSGEIDFEGQNIMDRKTNLNKLRTKIGMVFQNFNLFKRYFNDLHFF